ncbi:MAG: hypothetical protein AVO33_07340 [delta proteobacterium ML8_F1]|nr:MAG: hypothetical protein AVO33_07340 [delta proteobacterium ML8_F1]
MKILLIGLNTKYIHNNLAIENIMAFNRGIEGAEFKRLTFTINQSKEEVLRGIVLENPDIAGFSAYIWNIEMILDIVENLKKIRPGVRVVMGGPEVSYDPGSLLNRHPEIDYVISGEGEYVFGELTKNLLQERPPTGIAGLYHREGDRVVGTGMGRQVALGDIPTVFEGKDRTTHIVYYEASRGCPYNCSYCLSSTTRGLRVKPLTQVFEDLKKFMALRVPLVKFIDRTFNADSRRSLEILRFILENSSGETTFHFEISPNALTPEWIAALREAPEGLFQVEIGIQSVHMKVLKAVNRPMAFESIEDNLRQVCALDNLHTHVDLIAGLPYSRLEDFLESFDRVYSLGADHFQLGFLKLLKGSQLRHQALELGYRYDAKPPYEVLLNPWLSYEELLLLKHMEHLMEIYANSGHFTVSLEFILSFFQRPRDFFIEFSEFYESRGYFDFSHQLIRRVEILYEFLQAGGFENLAKAKALMKFDFYRKNRQPSGDFFPREEAPDKGALHELLHDAQRVARIFPQFAGRRPREILKAIKIVTFDYNVFEKPYVPGRVTGFFDYKNHEFGIIDIGGNDELHY